MKPNPEDKKQISQILLEWGLLILFVCLSLISVIYALGLGFPAFFEIPVFSGMNAFSLGVAVLAIGTIAWGFITYVRKNPELQVKGSRKRFIKSIIQFVGIRKVGLNSALLIVLAFTIGILFNLMTIHLIAYISPNTAHLGLPVVPFNEAVLDLTIVPLIEEMFYRVLFIGFFLTFFGKNRYCGVIALIISSFIFGFSHSGPTWSQLLKTAGGLMLGTIYLTRWGRNYLCSLSAHIGLNLVGIFTIVV